MATLITKNSSTASAVPLAADLTQGELAVNVTDKKLYSKDSGGSVVQIGGDVTLTGTQTLTNKTLTSPTLTAPVLGTPASGTVTNLTGTASININGTVGATTANTGAFTTLAASGAVTLSGGTANGVTYLNGSKVLTSGSDFIFNANGLGVGAAPNTSPGSPYYNLNVGTLGGGGIISGGTDTYFTNNLYISGNNYFAYTGGSAYGSYYNQTGGNHTWKTSTAAGTGGNVATLNTLMTLNSNGALALFGGASANGVGITFPATQSASSNANTLDDYEEGTWTATMTPLTSGTITLSAATGSYTKIGRQVTVTGQFNTSAVSSPIGRLRIGGFPFTVAGGTQFESRAVVGVVGGVAIIAIDSWVPSGGTFIDIYPTGTTTDTYASNIDASTSVYISATYFTT